MKIVVAGGTGFIGAPLVSALSGRGDEVVVLTRTPRSLPSGRAVAWTPPAAGAWTAEIDGADAVINLAGENIGARWTDARKRALVSSRIDATSALASALLAAAPRTRTFVSASAVGFYGNRGDETVDETSPAGGGFLAGLTAKWEETARAAATATRLVIPRFGIVLAPDGGALAKMLPPFRLGAGGPIGSGAQWMSWVDRRDVIRLILWLLDTPAATGVFNATAPAPVRNREFTSSLGAALHRPAFIPVPPFALRLLFGEMADETLLTGQKVRATRTLEAGFVFEHPELLPALRQML